MVDLPCPFPLLPPPSFQKDAQSFQRGSIEGEEAEVLGRACPPVCGARPTGIVLRPPGLPPAAPCTPDHFVPCGWFLVVRWARFLPRSPLE